jgi:hypothetical protein
MKKEFIPYEQALELAKLNFNEKCFGYYGIENKLHFEISSNLDSNLTRRNFLSAPLYQQAFRWFREKYDLDGKPEYFLNDWYCFIINDMKEEDTSRRLFTEFPSYEEAELECLKKLIEITQNTNK